MPESDPAPDAQAKHRFRKTLVRVLCVQAIALLLLGWMQHHFSH